VLVRSLIATCVFLVVLPNGTAASTRIGGEIAYVLTSPTYSETPDNWDVQSGHTFGGRFSLRAPTPWRVMDVTVSLGYVRDFQRVIYVVGTGSPPTSGSFSLAEDYLTAPLELSVKGPVEPMFVSIGPQFGYLVRAALANEPPGGEKVTLDILDRMRRFTLGITASLGIQIPISEHAWTVRAGASWGLLNSSHKENWEYPWRSRRVEMAVGALW
jgi:hypothetical protein